MGIWDFFLKRSTSIESLIKELNNKNEEVRKESREKIISLGNSAVEPLIEALKSDKWNVKMNAAIALGEIGDARAVEPLLQGLHEDIRIQAIQALGKIGDKRAEKPLYDSLNDNNATARAFAAEALGKLGHIDPLLKAMEDPDEFIKRTAIQSLVKTSDPRVVEAISRALRYSQDWTTRYLAAQKLGELGDPKGKQALAAALSDSEEMVRAAAQESLDQLKKLHKSTLIPN